MNKGIQILLESGTRIPWWFKMCRGVIVRTEKIQDRRVKVVQIAGGEACFFIGGSILIERMPGYRSKLGMQLIGTNQGVARRALQIRDLNGVVLEQNYYLCEKCFRNTGEVAKDNRYTEARRTESTITCKICGESWERRI